jgi:Cleft lip and palate transmembrane protein 1 (CLPTM1)
MLIFWDSGTRGWRNWWNKEDVGGDEPLVPCVDRNRQHPPCNVSVAPLACNLEWWFRRQLWNACIQEWRLTLEKEKGDGWRFGSNGMVSFLVKGKGFDADWPFRSSPMWRFSLSSSYILSIITQVSTSTCIDLWTEQRVWIDTSWMILFGQGMGMFIEAWKVTKAVDIKLIRAPPGSTLPYKLDIKGIYALTSRSLWLIIGR